MGVETSADRLEMISGIKERFNDIRCSRVMQLINIMSSPVRIHILCALTRHEFTVNELVDICDATVSNVSQQLKMMWMAGYLNKQRRGKQIYYSLKDERIADLIGFLEELYQPPPDGCLDYE
jgi:DNA-binding transcriptional ArsR family regulator